MPRRPKVAFPGRSASSTSGGTLRGTATTVVLSDCWSRMTGKPSARKNLRRPLILIFFPAVASSDATAVEADVDVSSAVLLNSPFSSSVNVSASFPESVTAILVVSIVTVTSVLSISVVKAARAAESISTSSRLSGSATVAASVPSGSSKTVVSFTDSRVDTTASLTALITLLNRAFLRVSESDEIEFIVVLMVSTSCPMISEATLETIGSTRTSSVLVGSAIPVMLRALPSLT